MIIKRSGEKVPYDEGKLRFSLQRSGASKEQIAGIVAKVKAKLKPGMSTTELYRFVSQQLGKRETIACCKYGLKDAMINLGFRGFVFEKFIGKLMAKLGYSVKLNQIMPGKNVTHEIDVSATKGNERIMIECKHHSKPWLGTHINVALATYARFLDVQKNYSAPMLVTNTKFTTAVINYSRSVNLRLLGWKYPRQNSLEQLIEQLKLYPVTALHLPKHVLDQCLDSGVITIDDVKKMTPATLSKRARIPQKHAQAAVEQAKKF